MTQPPSDETPALFDATLADEVRRLARLITSLRDDTMRRVVMQERLSEMGPARALGVLAFLRACAPTRPSPEFTALETFMWVLSRRDGLSYDFVRDLYEAAQAQGAADLARLLVTPPAARTLEGRVLEPDPRMAEVPLGTRKQLARKPDRAVVERLIKDPEPSVIRQLLLNSKLTEGDVLQIVSQRPAVPEVLREVWTAERWARRYRIKLALCRNPYTPGDVGLRILPMLRLGDLRDIWQDPTLHERLRDEARRLRDEKKLPH